MSQQGVQLDQEQFCCSICLDLLKDPVTINCGHSYCSSCIEGCWNHDDQKGVYSCPQCRQTFAPRPVLKKNNLLAEVMEKLKKTGLQAASPAKCNAGPKDVACDVCTGRKQKALKSCLVCLASYCETHLQPHYESPAFKKHKLVKASTHLQEKICSRHDEVMKMFCRTDQQCICYLCSVDEHKGHDTVSAAAERTEKQRELGEIQQKDHQNVQERQKEVKEVKQAVESLNRSAQAAVENSERIFTQLIYSIERRRAEVKEQIRAQQRAAVSQAEGLLERLEQEIAELRRRDVELEQLVHAEDHIHFLQMYSSLSGPSESPNLPSISVQLRPLRYFEDVSEVVSKLSEKIENVLKEEWTKISTTVNAVDLFAPPEPKTRADFLGHSCHFTLDTNTTSKQLSLSEGNRKVTLTLQQQSYPDHPERFYHGCQVLSREGLSGRCYWEAEWSGMAAYAAVSYKNIESSGKISIFGQNDKSWSLMCCTGGYRFTHNKVESMVPGPLSNRIGVYLDHSAGTLSFYSVSNTMTLLHKVQTTFTQPLYPGFGLGYGMWEWGDSVELSELII